MKAKKYKQAVIPNAETPEEWKGLKLQQLRTIIFKRIRSEYSGMVVTNLDTRLPIIISVTSARKTAFGEAIYYKKAASVLVLPDIIKYAKYNNWGAPKPTDGPNIIGYLNFKCKCNIDGKTRMSAWQFNSKRAESIITTLKSTRKSLHLKGAMLNLIHSVGCFCYRGGYILSAVPLRLDNQFIFHSVSATSCLQNYNKNQNAVINIE